MAVSMQLKAVGLDIWTKLTHHDIREMSQTIDSSIYEARGIGSIHGASPYMEIEASVIVGLDIWTKLTHHDIRDI